MKKKLSITIVTYNSGKLIFDCLDSIYKYNDIGDSLEVIIVDNCSEDQEYVFNKIKLSYSSEIKLIASQVNGGYGRGNNQGIYAAKASKVIVMNPDIRLVSPIFRKIINYFEVSSTIGMMGVSFVDGSNNLYFKPEFSNLFNLVFSKILIKLGIFDKKRMFFSGSFLIFDKDTFINAGTFDEEIFLFHEEADISNRILSLNKDVLLAKDVLVEHLAHGRDVNPYLLSVGAESRKYYFNKYNADIEKYYLNILFIYKAKYILALVMHNKLKADEFKAWIEMCKNKGKFKD